MKKVFIILTGILFLTACHNDQGGAVNDGKKTDLQDTTKDGVHSAPSIDTSKMKDREDIQQRDTTHSQSH